ncbi:MAG: GC-type dockerin domain-anchored protein [Flavobacteriales bacterium]|nr:GC-type dockerin domain-anchored protein [Flavobacteriales bacterium]
MRCCVLLLFLVGLFTINASAQYSSPEILATSGGTAIVGEVEIAWTFGEAIVLTMEGPSNILTNGFHQSDEFCFGDFDFDGNIAAGDLLIFLTQFSCEGSCIADLNGDGMVNAADLLVFLSVLGTSCYGNLF